MYEVATREIPERSLLCLKRNVDERGAWALGKEFIAILRERPLPKMNGREGAMFSIYWNEVSADSDGPVEWCKPVPEETAKALASHYPEFTCGSNPHIARRMSRYRTTRCRVARGGTEARNGSSRRRRWRLGPSSTGSILQVSPSSPRISACGSPTSPRSRSLRRARPTATSPFRSRRAKARRLVHDHFEHEGAVGRGASHLADDLADAGRRAAGVDEHLHRRRRGVRLVAHGDDPSEVTEHRLEIIASALARAAVRRRRGGEPRRAGPTARAGRARCGSRLCGSARCAAPTRR